MSRKIVIFLGFVLGILFVTSMASAQQSPMAKKLIVYGDIVSFASSSDPLSCTAKSRYNPGDAVGFRITVIDPLTGKVVETAEAVVHVTYGGKTEDVAMRYRGAGSHPHPGMWTAKWVIPDNAPTGIVKYTITATDSGRSGTFEPFQVDASMLTIVAK